MSSHSQPVVNMDKSMKSDAYMSLPDNFIATAQTAITVYWKFPD